jgi:hypothetical protein
VAAVGGESSKEPGQGYCARGGVGPPGTMSECASHARIRGCVDGLTQMNCGDYRGVQQAKITACARAKKKRTVGYPVLFSGHTDIAPPVDR